MKNYKTLGITFISIFTFNSLLACGGGWWEAEYYNIYEQRLMLDDNTYVGYYNHSTDVKENSIDDNIAEWHSFFEEKYSTSAISNMIYNDTPYKGGRAAKNTLENALAETSASKRTSFIKYFLFAKKCEQISTANNSWYYYDEKPAIDTLLIQKLTILCKGHIKSEKNEFLKERYYFQLIKTYYYGEMYEDAIASYNEFFASKNEKSLINYWALDYKAGAEMHLGNTLQANHDFLQVFTNCPSRSHTSYHSMTFSDQEQFDRTLNICNDDEMKAMFHFVRGINKNSVALEDIKSAQQYAPFSNTVKKLLSNEIVKVEHAYWNKHIHDDDEVYYWHNHDKIDLHDKQLMEYISDSRLFVESNINVEDDYWNITLAYLHSLEKNYQKSDEVLTKVMTKNESFVKQAAAIQLLNYVHLHPHISVEDENHLGQNWKDYNKGKSFNEREDSGTINEYLADYFHEYYESKNEVMSMLFNGEDIGSIKWEDNGELLSPNSIKKLQESYLKIDKTELLIYGEQSFTRGATNLENELIELEATLHMRDPYSLEKAIALFEKLTETQKLEYNPFNMKIRDCIWGGWRDRDNACEHKPTNHTKLTIAKKLLEMREKAENEQSAIDYYLLGNAYYNMTYFGHEWETLSYSRSGSYITGFHDCGVALDFYEKAAEIFTDEEMQAKSTFMAAKCTQNIYLVENNLAAGWLSSINDSEEGVIEHNLSVKEAGYREHFDILINDYSDTDFYDEMIEECSFFDLYVNR